jgi:hypothetical protein
MKKLAVLLLIISFVLVLSSALHADTDTEMYEPKQGAEEPEKVYARYVQAVHSGDINMIRSLVYSKSLVLWNQNAKQMLAMTKNNLPQNPVLNSKRSEKQFQYNYLVMNYTGQGAKGGLLVGEVRMIVENGVWKLYQENWRTVGR